MEEVHKQMGEIAGKQNDKISELNAEIRKLKAMIVKHESRIRTLETKNRDTDNNVHTQQNPAFNNNGHSGEDLDPDEVWKEEEVKLNLYHFNWNVKYVWMHNTLFNVLAKRSLSNLVAFYS